MTRRALAPAIPAAQREAARIVVCPFKVVYDSREQQPYTFETLQAGAGNGAARIKVEMIRAALGVGDYSVFSMPQVVVERKSKEDLYGSVVRRANFVGRLERMAELAGSGYAAVMVESNYLDLIAHPPRYSKLRPRSLSRTLIAWRQRYRVDWWFMPNREAAERATFRILERFYLDHRSEETAP